MKARSPKIPAARNPETYLRHRREVLMQITLPLMIGVIIVVVVGLFTAFGASAGALSQMADAAFVELIIPALAFGLIIFAILAACVYGLARLLNVLPFFFLRTQIFFFRVQLGVMQVNDRLVEPVLQVHSFTARLRAFRRSVRQAFWFR